MAGAGLRFAFLVLLLNVSAFGAPAPPETGGVHEEKAPAEGDPASKTSLDSATLIRSSESMKPQSGAASLDSSRESDHTGEKESKMAKNLDLPATNSLVSNPDLKDPKESVNLQTKSKSADVPDSSPQKSDPEDIKNLPPATESSQPHTSVSDSSAHKPDLNDANQSGSLPGESKGVQSVASVPDSTSLQSNPEEIKETKNLSPSTENGQSGATVLESSPQNPDHNKANQNKKLSEESKIVQSDVSLVDPSSRKPDHNEDKQSENVPEKSKTIQSDVSVADSPILKSGQNEASQNEKTPHSSAAGEESTPQKSDHNEDNQKDNGPAVAGNSLSDIPLPKDDDVDDDSLVDDEAFEGGKEGEDTVETSQSDKEEAKNSPVGPSPKNGSENSHFFAYLVTTAIVVAALYIAYHNKRKIIAFALEGKKSKVIRRPKSSDYQRLDQKI